MPMATPTTRELHPAADDHPQDVAALRADRHAQPDLLRPLADGVGDDAVEADRGEEERDGREQPRAAASRTAAARPSR